MNKIYINYGTKINYFLKAFEFILITKLNELSFAIDLKALASL